MGNPGGKGRISFPPFYSQIRSTFWYDYPLGNESEGIAKDGMGKLRHDSYYDDRLYQIMDEGLVTEIHFETREQREQNVTGAMVSLLHGLLGWGKNFGGCTCVSDPVGMPVIGGILDNKLTGDRRSTCRGLGHGLCRQRLGREGEKATETLHGEEALRVQVHECGEEKPGDVRALGGGRWRWRASDHQGCIW